ncbi:MAG: hypothetical protein IJW65_06870 [Clostridia bacterium]|nr:hypothetical protein [Clostridia bacterium]
MIDGMKFEVNIEPYNDCIEINRIDGSKIECCRGEDVFVIKANAEGLTLLANICLTLAQEEAPNGSHVHLDEYNFLKNGSTELIISKE